MSDMAVAEEACLAAEDRAPAVPQSRLAVALIELALAVGSFGIGTGEFAIMGLLPNVAQEFNVTTPEAGYAISAYALGVVVGAPIIAVLAAKLARQTLLLLLMAVFAVGNAVSAVTPTFESFVLLRFLTGLPHGAYFGVAALVAASLVPPNKRTQAVARVMLGLTVATLLGTPIATLFGQILSWRIAFGAVGFMGALTVVLIWLFLPKDKVQEGASPMRELGAFRRKQVWFTLGIGAVGFGGLFSVFSYIASTATEVAGMPDSAVPVMMALFGSGMIVGNLVGAWFADRNLMATIGGVLASSAVVMTVLWLTAENPYLLSACVFLVGCSVAIGPALQTRLMDVAADAQTLAAALNHSAFNVANALGAWLGGLAIAAGYGFASTGWVGAALAVAGLVVFGLSLASDQRSERSSVSRA
ncbi:MFS transporter [Microvirga sp. 3-52]|uniref:MFS transporter n=1 Tax=Microvirga sp. 3-52 TaxID=2792425 RepID=UPI001AC0478D|nr:MFS transporter [Microvirga sp. 3-52]MBO1903617.1 MFS transporter [Microvirga sp. 3-52]MBS7450791.1 MFS transporter [Microvirga sp. 3-52]